MSFIPGDPNYCDPVPFRFLFWVVTILLGVVVCCVLIPGLINIIVFMTLAQNKVTLVHNTEMIGWISHPPQNQGGTGNDGNLPVNINRA